MTSVRTPFADNRLAFSRRFYQIALARGINFVTTPLLLDDNQQRHIEQLEQLEQSSLNKSASYICEPTDRVTLIIPGLLGNSLRALIAPLVCAREKLTVEGYNLKVVWVSGRSGCDHNAAKLREHVLETAERSGQSVNIIGYSKGCADALHMLGNHPDTHSSVFSLVSYAGVVHGTPLAESVPDWLNILLRYIPLPSEGFGDGLAINDLSYDRRHQWLLDHPLPANVRFASIAASPQPTQISRVLKGSYKKLALINPDNDSQVIANDSIIPNGELLAVTNADHWAIALPIAERHILLSRLIVNKNAFPRDVLIQSIIDHLSDIPLT